MKKLIFAAMAALMAATVAYADFAISEYEQVAGVSNQVMVCDAKLDALITAAGSAPDVSEIAEKLDALSAAYSQTGDADFAILDVSLNVGATGYELPDSSVERAELLSGAYIAVSSPGYLPVPLKANVSNLVNFKKRFLVPVRGGATNTVTVALVTGDSATCAYHATPATVQVSAGAIATAALSTVQMSGSGAIVEVCRIQPYTSTASDSGDSWLAQKVTTASGTRWHIGYYDHNGTFVKDAGIKVGVWTVPEGATSVSDCTEGYAYGSAGDTDIFSLLKVLGEEKIVDVVYTGDSAAITNKFVRFSPVYAKTTYEEIAIPVHDAQGATVSTRTIPCIIRWFCDVAADTDYHLHSAFVRYVRNGDAYAETPVPYAYVSRYPLNNVSLTCGGVSYAMAKSQGDGSNEIGNTRAEFLDRCRNVNNAAITVSDPATGDTLLTLAANADSRAMSMIDLPMMSLIEDLAYLLFGIDSQGQLRGVSSSNAGAQQVCGITDYIAALGIKIGGRSPASAEYNFNFLDIEGGTWSAPGCMFPNYTSVMERITTTDAEGVPTSTTRNRYAVAIDRADYNPGSSDIENLLANGYRWVSFNIGNKRRIGLDDTQVMRDAKLFTADQTTKNVNYASVDEHWQGGAPAAIGNYSATATYAENSYAVYEGKLYQCTTPVTSAEAFDSEKWTLQTSKTIISRSYYLVARGINRSNGDSLGAVALVAYNGLSHSGGYNWRSRLSLLPLGE